MVIKKPLSDTQGSWRTCLIDSLIDGYEKLLLCFMFLLFLISIGTIGGLPRRNFIGRSIGVSF